MRLKRWQYLINSFWLMEIIFLLQEIHRVNDLRSSGLNCHSAFFQYGTVGLVENTECISAEG